MTNINIVYIYTRCHARVMLRACSMLVRCCGFVKKKFKNIWRKIVVIHNILKKKTTKLNSQLTYFFKNKIDKNNSEKNHNKKKQYRETL